ncbi:toxin co-regulated pilus biosynthesis Q family protein [Alteromonas sp. CYL-A6]|uniref:toxin co-regulated pilus biosynthesis Q family protein n=1 Tax=Alteromonas nitratireducens TaxID=3390813 RepID=UPI0034B02D72
MAQKSFSSTMFWAKHIGLAMVLVIVAGVVIFLEREMEQEPVPEGETKEKTVQTGLSEFYREFRQSSTNPIKEDSGDFVMDLNASEQPLDAKLEAMSSRTRPVEERWTGEHKYRTFRAGTTLREAITQYAQQEGMQVIWDLDQDFVIKHQFQMDNTISGSLAKIASAINSNFEGEVKAYLCPGQRSLVVTSSPTAFLKENCTVVRPG